MSKKINFLFVIIGIVAVAIFIVLAKFTYNSRDILVNGELRYCLIVKIEYSTKDYATVLIDGEKLDAGLLRTRQDIWGKRIGGLQVGDSIAVKYIKGRSRVVQADVELWRYYLHWGLEAILLIVGLIFIIGGFMGKTMHNS
jgi:hypothetical protein